MTRILCLLAIFSSLFPFKVLAQNEKTAADFSELRLIGTVQVDQVVSPTTLQLKDGRLVYLTGLDFPDFDPYEPGKLAVQARDLMKEFFEGKKVRLYQTEKKDKGRTNRMGHELGHIERSEDGLWAQRLLLENGLARVRTTQRNPEMAAQMYTAERMARTKNAGAWAQAQYNPLTPETALEAPTGFQIVQGRVHSVAIVRNRIFLNFGSDWRSDFTVAIDAGDRRAFTRANLDPLQWNGKFLQVRGWMESWNGPYIKADHPEQFEFLETSPPGQPEQPSPQASE